jgi:hypothetical protein
MGRIKNLKLILDRYLLKEIMGIKIFKMKPINHVTKKKDLLMEHQYIGLLPINLQME